MDVEANAVSDAVELCALLQCLGFTIKVFDYDNELSQEDLTGPKTVTINCPTIGINMLLEGPAVCCPVSELQNTESWQISGTALGKKIDIDIKAEELLLRGLPKSYRDHISKKLNDVLSFVRTIDDTECGSNVINKSANVADLCSKVINKSASVADLGSKVINKSASVADLGSKIINKSASVVDLISKSASIVDIINKSSSMVELSKEGNKSASILEIGTPKKSHLQLRTQTPTRYRSLDALIKDNQTNTPLGENVDFKKSTYTVCSTPGSLRRRNKTSSPIKPASHSLLESLIEAERVAESLRNKLAVVIQEYMEDGKHDSSITSMLDVSKISVLKGPESKPQFASSPNLSGLSLDYPKSRLKRFDSASTSNLVKSTADNIKSKLKRISPHNVFKKKDTTVAKDKGDGKSKLQSLMKPKIVTPIRTGKLNPEASPNFYSASKKKFSHIKSTIPRPTPKKE